MPLETPPAPPPNDQITAGYQAIVAALASSRQFTQLVRSFNTFADGVTSKILERVSAGNLPEATLLQSGASDSLGKTSRTWQEDKTFPLVIITDTMQVDVINQIKVAVIRAVVDLEESQYKGANFICNVNVSGGGDGTQGIKLPTVQTDGARGVDRWGSLINIVLSLYGDFDDLPA